MASLSVSSSSTIIDSRAPPSRLASASASSPSCISLPTLPIQSHTRAAKATAYCSFSINLKIFLFTFNFEFKVSNFRNGFWFLGRKIVRNVVTRATTEVGEAPATTTEAETTELPEIVKTAQEAVNTLTLFIQ
uniref:AT2G46820 protein n=1 Tax=Arabidopsis thaliana TaxID=3702 RepID=C0Z228_ARATH|nr:AT2G46820 [Arabidopsis thaliana]